MVRPILFIDRDGTLIDEPQPSQQIDSLDKLRYLPGVFTWLGRIAQELPFRLVIVTNQDGLGTDSFPEDTFWPAHNRMLETFAGEGIHFEAVHMDRSFAANPAPTRKPGTAMLTSYLDGSADIAGSYVIGDRLTDAQLAQNLGCQALLLPSPVTGPWPAPAPGDPPYIPVADWAAIYRILKPNRVAEVHRKTNETDIRVRVALDGPPQADLKTGLHFLDHMLDQLSRHGGIGLTVHAHGDLHIDEHHTVEDTALTLGAAFAQALGDKRGLFRYGFDEQGAWQGGFLLPMDEAVAQVAIDFGGRPHLVWHVNFTRERIGDVPTEMWEHFFKSFTDAAKCNLYIKAEGKNEHHIIEAVFKGWARAIRMAVAVAGNALPSTKGVL